MNKTFFSSTFLVSATILMLGLLAGAVLLTIRPATAAPDCPASWPDRDYQGMFTDAEDNDWFIIRSTDSNGYTMVRAYPGSDRYAAGYEPGAPDETCHLLVRPAGAGTDLAQPRQVVFPREADTDAGSTTKSEQTTPRTLLEILDSLPPEERQAAIICLLPLAGSRTLEELNRDPDIVKKAIELGCIEP